MVNLDQEAPTPARVMFASYMNLNSGEYGSSKEYWGRQNAELFYQPLRKLYDRKTKGLQTWHKIMSGPNADLVTQEQLDTLAGFYDGLSAEYGQDWKERALRLQSHNEILVAAGKNNIEAITVPLFSESKEPAHKQLMMLTAALAGLQHLEAGMDLPVVGYNIGLKRGDDPQRGKIEYIAQGKQELVELALSAIDSLQKDTDFVTKVKGRSHGYKELDEEHLLNLLDSFRDHFNINILIPLSAQQNAVAQWRASAQGNERQGAI
jgi:hypothetical protein